MRKIFYFFFIYLCLQSLEIKAQDTLKTKPKAKFSLGFKGQLSISSDFKENLFVHFGGPGVTLSLKNWGLYAGMFPSVRFYQGGKFSPLLGAGAQIMYKKFVFPVVLYNINSQPDPNILVTYGVGYKF